MRPRLSAVIGRLTIVNILTSATGFVTGPLLARGLGAEGRGDLAAIIVPLTLAPTIIGLALPYYVNRESARGRPLNELIGSIGMLTLAISLVPVACAFPVASLLAEGRETVRTWLTIVFLTVPVTMVGTLLIGFLQGLESWGRLILARMIAFAVPFLGITVLFVLGKLTVASAAAVSVAGALVSAAPALWVLRRGGRPVIRAAIVRDGARTGMRAWSGGLAYLANARLDQLVMITAVPAHELGLYVVAATIAGAPGVLTNAITPPLLSRVAAGHANLLPQATRITLLTTALLAVALAAATPPLLQVVFGHEFLDATVMTLVLLLAALPFAGGSVLSAALQGDGAPGVPSLAEGLALGVTAAGLAVALGPLGALGAAFVSLAAYSVSFAFQLAAARRRWEAGLREYLVPTVADLRWARGRLPGRIALPAVLRRGA